LAEELRRWRTALGWTLEQVAAQAATLGACLAAVRQATLAELASAASVSIGEVRLGLRARSRQPLDGAEGPVSLPRDSSATLALLVSRGLLSAEKGEHATGRPLVYRATPGLLQLLGAETLEEVRGRLDAVRH
jgi:transcriptional regulator with XRE-family HTH domain